MQYSNLGLVLVSIFMHFALSATDLPSSTLVWKKGLGTIAVSFGVEAVDVVDGD
jgi:hypothetical protein